MCKWQLYIVTLTAGISDAVKLAVMGVGYKVGPLLGNKSYVTGGDGLGAVHSFVIEVECKDHEKRGEETISGYIRGKIEEQLKKRKIGTLGLILVPRYESLVEYNGHRCGGGFVAYGTLRTEPKEKEKKKIPEREPAN